MLIWAERGSAYVIAPAVCLGAVLVATGLTIKFIFPYNRRLAEHVTDQAELQTLLGKWLRLNWIRVSLWTVEWVAITTYFALHLR